MDKIVDLFVKLIEEQGGHVATIVILFGFIWWLLNKYIEKSNATHDHMKEQIDRLAAENRTYRIIFLKKMGLTDKELRDIVPGYQDDE